MPRANRCSIPGGVWHLTHRCHRREHLLKFARDRERWLHWLIEARQRYGLSILTFCVTCNHVHLVVRERGDGEIAHAMQLVQGRLAQEYNTRKERAGAFWEDHYHATAVAGDHHLMRCLCYVELNMVRAGVVKHPCEWPACGFHQIMHAKQRYRIVDRDALTDLLGLASVNELPAFYSACVKEALESYAAERDPMWTDSIAVGDAQFVACVRSQIGRVHGCWNMRELGNVDGTGTSILRDVQVQYGTGGPYRAVFGG